MSLTIWKVVLNSALRQDISVPEGAQLLTAREQGDGLCVWFKCDPARLSTKRRIAIVGTGHPVPEDSHYVGTGVLQGGALVLHVFELCL